MLQYGWYVDNSDGEKNKWARNGGIFYVELRSSSTAELEKRIFYVGGVDYIYMHIERERDKIRQDKIK